MKIINKPFPHVSIDNFIPNSSLVRAASESFDDVEDWVRYGGGEDNQIQFCSKLGRENVPPAALVVLDYIATHFNPNDVFGLTDNTFPDMSHYGGGMMITPNSREYSAILCLSEDYDSSFDLRIHNGKEHTTIPYKFNTLNIFKCSSDSWHGLPEITKGMDRKTLGVMYWSVMTDEDKKTAIKAKFNNNLEF